ncbi:YicC/YloC family endoribonuclease [Falsiroseomonas sp.]|uniref:YicC/YloC family endoribonuclease n=1 Tax=Falsiroseomonas sp. TaxID=2870721 RepID=UPI00273495EF|nr:YicC/YloC family endoribonuclease [Falsiroseomonas sp.]MDP3418123.1 YicC/YloC family endoribonuclease [Falsiroseomonas sp.]
MSNLASMTGFARDSGSLPDGSSFVWELRSVNGRGLDVRLRLPPGLDMLEAPLREAVGKRLKRGNLNATLTLKREDRAPRLTPDPVALEAAIALVLEVSARLPGAMVPTAEAVLSLPGVLRAEVSEPDEAAEEARRKTLAASFAVALDGLVAARAREGAQLSKILETLLGEIAALRDAAAVEAAGQPAAQRARLLENLANLLGEGDVRARVPEERLAQEVAMLAQRSDVREELDRLSAHITEARSLLASGAAIGRKMEFLTQEFVREANTLCSKSASVALTRVGLELKAAIERLREQAANVE